MYAQKSLWAPIAGAAVGMLLLLAPIAITLAASPSISFSSSGNTPFSTLTINGSGWTAGENVLIMFGLNSTTVAADASGSFSGATLQIPNVPSGTYVLLAVGQTSGMVAFNYVWVGSFFPTANPSGWYIAPGSNLTWSGGGWAAGETIHVMQGTTTLATFSADGSGAFTAQGGTVIPYSLRNSVVPYSVHGDSSSSTVNLFLAIADLYPWANPSVWYATPGTPVTWSGGGFGPNEMINVMLGSSSVASFAANATGGFSAMGATTLPFGSSPANYLLVGASSGVSAPTPITLSGFYPSLNPSSYYAAPGSIISLGGTGFAANEPITVQVNGSSTNTSTNGLGAFSIPSLQLPATPNSTVNISAQGGMSGAMANLLMTIGQYFPNITPSTYYAFPGDTVTFSGTGLAPNETLTVSGAASGTVAVNSLGNFSGANFVLPSPGTATYTFLGSQSGGPWSFPITVAERFAAIWFDNYWGVGGSPLTIFGSGFGSGENVAFSTGTTTFATGAADAGGNISHATAMPFAPAGPLTITGTGASSGASASANTNVAPIYPDIQLGSYAIAPGGSINVIGSGLLPNDPMQIVIDGAVVHEFAADAAGSFNNSGGILPALPEGLHDIVIKGLHSFYQTTITIWVLAST